MKQVDVPTFAVLVPRAPAFRQRKTLPLPLLLPPLLPPLLPLLLPPLLPPLLPLLLPPLLPLLLPPLLPLLLPPLLPPPLSLVVPVFAHVRSLSMPFTTIAGQSLATEILPLLEPERNTLGELLRERDASRLLEVAKAAYSRLDQRIQAAIEGSGMTPACSRGCSWCCHGVKVNVTAFEAIAIAAHLNAQQSPLREAACVAAERRREMNTNQLFEARDPCPFLGKSGQCEIYAVRPSACRRHCCMNSSECERASKSPKLKLPVTQHAPANVAGALCAMSWAAALEDTQLDYRTFELAAAVAVALTPGAPEQWIRGERVFDAALRDVDIEDREIIRRET